jgi:hypothetical protein
MCQEIYKNALLNCLFYSHICLYLFNLFLSLHIHLMSHANYITDSFHTFISDYQILQSCQGSNNSVSVNEFNCSSVES